jgi:hypothetical protein
MTGRADVLQRLPALQELAIRQAHVVSRAQLAVCSVTRDQLAAHVRANRWREVVAGVIVLHLGPIDALSRAWIAVLAGGPAAAICAWTALERHGLRGWERASTHVVVPRGRLMPALPLTTVHESRRHGRSDIVLRDHLPMHGLERAAVDAAAWSPTPRAACGLLSAVVQQGLTTTTRLLAMLETVGRVSHRRVMIRALGDIQGGSQAMSEIDLVRLCRRAGLPEPTRQSVRHDLNGRRRYLDAEWELGSGVVVGLEVDGTHHMEAGQWYDDLMRQSELVLPFGHRLLRVPALALRLEPDRVVALLRQALSVRTRG